MLFLSIILHHHFFLCPVLMLLLLVVVFLSIYQPYTIQPIAATAIIIIPAQNNNVLIPSTNPAVGSSGYYCKAHSSNGFLHLAL